MNEAPLTLVEQEVWQRYFGLLQASASPLLDAPEIAGQLRGQLCAVVGETFERVGLASRVASSDDDVSAQIGQDRAAQGLHPADSLRAGGLIFEAVLPVLTRVLRLNGRDDVDAASSVLNAVIAERMAVAAERYIEVLLNRVYDSATAERYRISRELHDVVMPAVLAVGQQLSLYRAYRDEADPRAEAKLTMADVALAGAVESMRSLAIEARHSLAEGGFEQSLERVLVSRSAEAETALTVEGDCDRLPVQYQQELLLIVQEAVRNALAHGRPQRVEVTVRVGVGEVGAHVSDDGCGFTLGSGSGARSMGLSLMRERAASLGGVTTVRSAPGEGTLVRVQVPLPPSLRAVQDGSIR